MKPRPCPLNLDLCNRLFAFSGRWFAVLIFLAFTWTSHADSAPVHVNRTVPKTESPKTALEFSAHPTSQELFQARIFEEPLVPIGGEPSPAENADLAAAVLGYARRSGPDDFSALTLGSLPNILIHGIRRQPSRPD